MRGSLLRKPLMTLALSLATLTGACTPSDFDGEEVSAEAGGGDAEAVEAEIAQRISEYLEILTVVRDADAAREYYTEDARLVGPGMDSDRPALVENMRATFAAGIQVQVNRRTIEVFSHGDAAYEIAQAEDVFLDPADATADTLRNHMFIRWERGMDGEWRFDRVLLSPMEPLGK